MRFASITAALLTGITLAACATNSHVRQGSSAGLVKQEWMVPSKQSRTTLSEDCSDISDPGPAFSWDPRCGRMPLPKPRHLPQPPLAR